MTNLSVLRRSRSHLKLLFFAWSRSRLRDLGLLEKKSGGSATFVLALHRAVIPVGELLCPLGLLGHGLGEEVVDPRLRQVLLALVEVDLLHVQVLNLGIGLTETETK